jgi:hypothetical protein
MDLSDPKALERFPDESFDHANNHFLTVPKNSIHARSGTSPSIWLYLVWKHRVDNHNLAKERGIPLKDFPKFCEGENWKRMWAINDGIFLQVQRLLKEGGVYTLAEFAYRKKKGVLVREKQIPQSLRPQPLPGSRREQGAGSSTKSVPKKFKHRLELLNGIERTDAWLGLTSGETAHESATPWPCRTPSSLAALGPGL